MASRCQLSVPGGTVHVFSRTQLDALQSIVTDLGAATFPLFLRLGSTPRWRMQPITARTLLAEVEKFRRTLHLRLIPGMSFRDEAGAELGSMFIRADERPLIEAEKLSVAPTPEGIRLVLEGFPPPAGFRSRPGLPPMHYECYFSELRTSPEGWMGLRTPDMGGSGAPVPLPAIPLPPATKWDLSRVAGRPAVATVVYVEPPATEVYRDLLHALDTAGNESIRLKQPLEFRRDA
ncbi:MAG TPA: hypothetical protein VD973_10460 [Symbiobacteriaceae bacterium]|nr:hypothetical protein [Symbiobacteriaceae bacterium]